MVGYSDNGRLISIAKMVMVCAVSSAVSSASTSKVRADEGETSPRKASNARQIPRPIQVDEVTLKLFEQYILRSGKISSDSVDAAVVLVAARGGHNRHFVRLVLDQFDKIYSDRKHHGSYSPILACF